MMSLSDPLDHELFRIRILDTAAWCSQRLRIDNPARSLRSKALIPPLLRIHSDIDASWNSDYGGSAVEAVDELCRRRAAMIDPSRNVRICQAADQLIGGRILLFYPFETLTDGAAKQSSEGFFDNWNIPPWDIWVWYWRLPDNREVLYSWVPAEVVPLADAGVSVNPENCICWLDV